MSMMGVVCQEVMNYFIQNDVDIHASNYVISGGSISPVPFLKNGQYYRIVGSVLNDGVYQHGVDDMQLADEEFYGAVWSMRVPRDFVQLVDDIEAWNAANAKALSGPFSSESFDNYSYTIATSDSGGAYTWKDHFKGKLNGYRRMFLP